VSNRYGTLVCDLEGMRPSLSCLIGSQPLLAQQSQISIVARDRGGGYAVAALRARPHAI